MADPIGSYKKGTVGKSRIACASLTFIQNVFKESWALILEQETGQGETLGDLLFRLESSNHEAWRGIFEAQTGQIQPAILIVWNGTLLSHSDVAQTPLSDGDQITLRIVPSGG